MVRGNIKLRSISMVGKINYYFCLKGCCASNYLEYDSWKFTKGEMAVDEHPVKLST